MFGGADLRVIKEIMSIYRQSSVTKIITNYSNRILIDSLDNVANIISIPNIRKYRMMGVLYQNVTR